MERISLTPEQEKLIPAHLEKWRTIAHRTTPMTDADKKQFSDGIIAFYAGAQLPQLSPDDIIFVRSPTEGRIVAGLLSAAYHLYAEKSVDMAYIEQLRGYCLNLPTILPPPTSNEKYWNNWATHPYDSTRIKDESGLGEWGATCVRYASRMWHGGNMDVTTEAFVSFVRDNLPTDQIRELDLSIWNQWEKTVTSAGGRYMHENFVVVCDFPTALRFDGNDRPHGDGVAHAEWSDGSKLYHHHGLRVPAFMIEHPELITYKRIMNEDNAEIRRAMLEIIGPAAFMQQADAKVVHEDKDMYDRPRRLLRVDMAEPEEPVVMIEVTNSSPEPDGSYRKYLLRVDPNAYDGQAGRNCQAAIASTWRLKAPGTPLMFKTPQDYVLEIET